jgi:hypothetical protein
MGCGEGAVSVVSPSGPEALGIVTVEWLILAGIFGAVVLYAVVRLALVLDALRRNASATDDFTMEPRKRSVTPADAPPPAASAGSVDTPDWG